MYLSKKFTTIVRWLLLPFSCLYGLIIRIRNLLYNKEWLSSKHFEIPIICVGNVAIGGTGKTPMVEYLIRLLQEPFQMATLSRGYGRRTKGFKIAGDSDTAATIGDEPMQFYTKYSQAIVAVDEDRSRAIDKLTQLYPDIDLVVLDDALQHRRVAADCNIVLTDYHHLYTNDFFLPTGNLRDERKSIQRAHIIVVTKCPYHMLPTEAVALRKKLLQHSAQDVFFSTIAYGRPYHIFSKNEIELLPNNRVALVSGIANPKTLRNYIQRQTHTKLAFEKKYKDHHTYSVQDCKNIQATYEQNDSPIILTTEKDATRLAKFTNELATLPLYVQPITTQLLFNETAYFNQLIIEFVISKQKIMKKKVKARGSARTHKTTKQTHNIALLEGKIDITNAGMGYVTIPNMEVDILIRQKDLGTALNGDTVRIKIVGENSRNKRKEGSVVSIIKRKQTEFIGTIEVATKFGFFTSDKNKNLPDIYIPIEKINGAQNGDRVVIRLAEVHTAKNKPRGEVIRIISLEDENDAAMNDLLAETGFSIGFSKEIIYETAQLNATITTEELKIRKDCRNILTFTIDPADAKDFDDAISINRISEDLFEIGVHIADVSHYVRNDSALDTEAYLRATSVYLPDRVNPMLPEKISNELCSLRPNEDKRTFSAIFQMNRAGEIKNTWFGKTIIHSDKRFTYEQVQESIEMKQGIFLEEILLLNSLAQQFRAERFKKGAINFSSKEVRFILDDKQVPIGVQVKESKEAHQLVEEFMLLANKHVAIKVATQKTKIPFPYRIHDVPDEKKLTQFAAYANRYGYKIDTSSPDKIAQSYNQMLVASKDKPEHAVLQTLGIRTMAKAIYSTNNIGHYGLSFENYCHFTSPIRRYPDIIVHRVLSDVLANNVAMDNKMEQKCKHCSDRERAAMECERAGNKYKQVEYMRTRIGEICEGVINGVAGFGFWVETSHQCEGFVSAASLSEEDEFQYIESEYCLTGLHTGRKFNIGQRVQVKIIAANLYKRQLDFEWIKQ